MLALQDCYAVTITDLGDDKLITFFTCSVNRQVLSFVAVMTMRRQSSLLDKEY